MRHHRSFMRLAGIITTRLSLIGAAMRQIWLPLQKPADMKYKMEKDF